MRPILSYQPFKGITTIAVFLYAPSYLVLHALVYTLRRFRPVRDWSLWTSLGNAWLRLFYRYAVAVQLEPEYANPTKLKERYVLVQPGPPELYMGLLDHDTIKPVPGPAIWFPKPLADDGERRTVVIHFQGGAFVTATDPVTTGALPARIFEEQLGAITFYPQYRISRDEGSRFPAALQDAVTFYYYVLDLGVDPRDIVLSGDSAGGGLVVALLRYIEEYGRVPRPRGAMIWSPWVEISSDIPAKYEKSPHLHTDYLTLGLSKWGRQAYEPLPRTEATERYLTQTSHPFASKTPIFVNVGSVELIYDEVKLFAERMAEVEGNRILYDETKNAPHDIILAGWMTGFVAEAEDAVRRAGEFFGIIG